MTGVEQREREVHGWLSYGTLQGLVTLARVLDTRAYLWYLLLMLFVVRKEIERWKGKREQDGHLRVRVLNRTRARIVIPGVQCFIT